MRAWPYCPTEHILTLRARALDREQQDQHGAPWLATTGYLERLSLIIHRLHSPRNAYRHICDRMREVYQWNLSTRITLPPGLKTRVTTVVGHQIVLEDGNFSKPTIVRLRSIYTLKYMHYCNHWCSVGIQSDISWRGILDYLWLSGC